MIDHLSPSSINLWISAPALWLVQYVHGVRSSGPAAWRGIAVERAIVGAIRGGLSVDEATAEALTQFDVEAAKNGEITPAEKAETIGEIGAEIPDIVGVALPQVSAILESLGGISHTQNRLESDLGCGLPVIGYADIMTGNGTVVDLKVARSIPGGISTAKGSHLRQVAFYANAAGTGKAALLYLSKPPRSKASHNGVRMIEIPPDVQHSQLRNLSAAAKSLAAAIKAGPDLVQSIVAPDYDSYLWDSRTRAKAEEVW